MKKKYTTSKLFLLHFKTQVKYGGAYQEGAGSTIGEEEVEQVNSFLSRIAITCRNQVC